MAQPDAPTTVVLCALTSTDGILDALRDVGGESVLARLVRQCQRHADVTVLARSDDVVAVSAAVDVSVVGVDSAVGAVDWLAGTPAPTDHDLVVIDASLAAFDLAIEMIVDAVAAGTKLVIRPTHERGAPVRCARQRVVAAGSAGHRLERSSHRGGGALRIAPADRDVIRDAAAALPGIAAAQSTSAAALDVTAWLTVALVRAGRRVRPVPLPANTLWERIRGADEAAVAARQIATRDEEPVRLAGAVKAQDGFFTTFFVSTYSRYIARWAARRGWSPDQVTALSMLTGIAAAVAFATGVRSGMIAGAILLQVAFMLDCVDGQLARYARLATPLGAWLDSVFDRGKEYVVYAGLAIGGIRAGDDATLWLLAAGALALQTVRHTIDFGYGVHQDRALGAAQVAPFDDGDEPDPGFWDRAATDPTATSTTTVGRRSVAGSIVHALRRGEAIAPIKWAKRIVPLPIGERFALISVVAAIASPRAVFVALLVWGGAAALYTFGGRLVRSWA